MYYLTGLSMLAVFFFPQDLLAWGPVAHIEFGLKVLENTSQILPFIRDIILQFPADFLRGCFQADIIIGKKYSDVLVNPHSWNIGFKIYNEAWIDQQRAFATGYLCHLAADIISHNYYIPYKLSANFLNRTTRHFYWELRFDVLMNESSWQEAKRLSKEKEEYNHILLSTILTHNLFPFKTNKRIFSGVTLFQQLKRWKQMVKTVSQYSRLQFQANEVAEYRALSLEFIQDLLGLWDKSKCIGFDPSGANSLGLAMSLRKQLKTKIPKKGLSPEFQERIAQRLQTYFLGRIQSQSDSPVNIEYLLHQIL